MYGKDEQPLTNDFEATSEERPALLSEDYFQLPAEELRGSRPGDMRVRIVLPRHPEFRRVSQGVLEATSAISTPQNRVRKAISLLKHILIGMPLATAQARYERLNKFKALALFGANPISSIAYATEAILLVLVAAGSGSLWSVLPMQMPE